jgi:selT/selW/selH-like putative selenoprotein
LADELRTALGVEAKLLPGADGIFDVLADDKLMFSKFQTGRFPHPGEMVEKLKQQPF